MMLFQTEDIPQFLNPYLDVFNENLCQKLPPHRKVDLSIELLPDAELPKCQAYPLTKQESQIVKGYIKKILKNVILDHLNLLVHLPCF